LRCWLIHFHKGSKRLQLLYGALFTLAVMGLVGGLAFNIYWNYGKVASRFHGDVSHMSHHVRELMAQNESILSGFSAFLLGSKVDNIDATKAYAQRMLDRYPHILMFEVAQRVDSTHLEPFSSYLISQNVKPRVWSFDFEKGIVEHNLLQDGEALPVIFIEPQSENSQLGLNLKTIEFINSVAERFGRSDKLLMTEPFELINGESAIVMMQAININDTPQPRYISLLVIKAEQLMPAVAKDADWSFSLICKDSTGASFTLLDTGQNKPADDSVMLLPELVAQDHIMLKDFDLKLEIRQQVVLADLDWLQIAAISFLMIAFPLLIFVMYKVHREIDRSNQEQQQKLYSQANFDNLTGLANRMHFEDFGQKILFSAERNATHVGLYFVDLNGFKQINDNLGHDAGDKVLVEVANTLLDNVRQGDIVARIGGDEFAILVDRVNGLHDVVSILNKLRQAVAEINLPEIKGYPVSASIGFSFSEFHGYELSGLLKIADNSMYGEKQDHYKTNAPFRAAMGNQ